MDPKVEYKREGMRLFESMWESIGERVTDLIFRMESSLNEDFIRSTWVEGQARHDDAAAASAGNGAGDSNTAGQQAAEASNQTEQAKAEPIRNKGPRVGRNDPCPCGSGKKYKACHMRTQN
jgi:preprotein translocase subunit SecA